jgi:lysophospholipase L1-like esterase
VIARLLGLLLILAGACMPAGCFAKTELVRIILVGDSTMASRTGYGDALCKLFRPGVVCVNCARGGRSSGSYRAEGLWEGVLDLLRDRLTYQATFVLIQFGHNDQPGKPGRSTDLDTEFPANLTRYADEAQAAGAEIVLLTPLTRRSFRHNVLLTDLKPWADATRRVAESHRLPLVDLYTQSAAAVAAMGSAEADTLAEAPPSGNSTAPASSAQRTDGATNMAVAKFDYTHLGPKGSVYFARLVAQGLAEAVPGLAPLISIDKSDK